MSRTSRSPAHRPRKTAEDYLSLPDDVRAELIDGELYVTPSPFADHQTVVLNLASLLRAHVRRRDLGRVFVSPLDVVLPTGDIVQPDVLFVARSRQDIVRGHVHGVPDLVIEVVSPDRPERDRFVKRILYERNEVPEYWIVDTAERSVEVLRPAGGTAAPATFFTGDDLVASPTFAGLAIPLAEIFDPA